MAHAFELASLYEHPPATHSIISGACVLKVSWAFKITPTLFFVPSESVIAWLMHLPSKKTLALVLMDTPDIFSSIMMWAKINLFFLGFFVF